MIDLGHVIETFCTATVPIALYMWGNRNQAKKENQTKHEENRMKLDELLQEREYHPPHSHWEKNGQLTASGIRYAKLHSRD